MCSASGNAFHGTWTQILSGWLEPQVVVTKEGKRRSSSIICLTDPAERMPLVFPVPPLSTRGANLVAFFFSASYVVSLYLSKHTRLGSSPKPSGPNGDVSQNRTRDDPSVIKARMFAASTSTVLSCVVVFLLVWHIVDDLENVSDLNLVTTATQWNLSLQNAGLAFDSTMARLGLTLFEDHSVFPYFVTPILYLGPLYATFLDSKLPFQSGWSWDGDVSPVFNTLVGIRNYFFGPITEELVFRACVLAVYHLAGSSRNKMIFLSPLLFGLGGFICFFPRTSLCVYAILAHLHHAWEVYTNGGKTVTAAKRALLITCELVYDGWLEIRLTYVFAYVQ